LLIGLLVVSGLTLASGLALAQTSPITPDGIAYLSEADTLTAGKTYNITVQILYAGGQLKSEGVRVYFQASDTSIIQAELGTYALTDKDGIANYTVTPGKTGNVTLTAMAMNTNSGISAVKKFHIIEGLAATPTATTAPSPSPIQGANATATAAPPAEPTPTTMPTIAPTITTAPTSPPPSGDANAQAAGILTAGVVIAVIIIVLILIVRVLNKK
jgi:hypothetical protein